jgi:hypothetical protein
VPELSPRRKRHRRTAAATIAAFLSAFVVVAGPAPAHAAASTLGSGQELAPGQEIDAGAYRLVMQTDGNLVEYTGGTALFASDTAGQAGDYAVMQTDGNLVVYTPAGQWRWQTGTNGYGGGYLAIQTDGNVVVYQGGAARWARSWMQTAAGAQAYSQVVFVHYGWSVSSQYNSLVELWNRESGWRWNVCNGGALYPNCPYTTVAYGIPQSLPGTKMASEGPDWTTDGLTQVRWGLDYIHSAYGTPQAAWNHEVAYGWY